MKRVLLLPLIIFSICLNAQIAITEMLCNPSGTEPDEEWIELFNYSQNSIDIQNWVIEDEGSDMDIITTSNFIITPGDFAIITRDKSQFEFNWLGNTPNAMVLEVPIVLANSVDELILKDNNGNVIWNLAYGNDDTEGRATFFTENEFIVTDYGNEANPGVDRDGNDVTNSLGYEKNSVTTDPDSYTATSGDLGSPLLGAYTPLPISLTSFTAKPIDANSVALNWSTESEENNKYFSIEYSMDGRNFTELEQVAGAGTTFESQNYEFMHKEVGRGSNYYRLRQVDFDGTFSFSEIEVVVLAAQNEISVHPTLAQQEIVVGFSENVDVNGTVEVVNWLGQIVLSNQFSAKSDEIIINVRGLEKGHYIVRIHTESEIKTSRFIKF